MPLAGYTTEIPLSVTAPEGGLSAGDVIQCSLFETHTLACQGKCRPDRKDFRLLYNGSEIDRVMLNTGSFAFRLQASVPSGSTTLSYSVAYGKPTESTNPAENPRNVWPHYYDGNDLASLTISGSVTAQDVPRPNFIKYSGNPVLTRGGVGAYDHTLIRQPELYFDGTYYWATYDADETGLARSTNLVTWEKRSPLAHIDGNRPGDPIIHELVGQSGLFITWAVSARFFGPYTLHIATASSVEGVWTDQYTLPRAGLDSEFNIDGHFFTPDNGTTWYIIYGAADGGANFGNTIALARSDNSGTPLGGTPSYTKLGAISSSYSALENPRFFNDATGNHSYVWGNWVSSARGEAVTRANVLLWSQAWDNGVNFAGSTRLAIIEPGDPGKWDDYGIGVMGMPVIRDGMLYALYDANNQTEVFASAESLRAHYYRDAGLAIAPYPFRWGKAIIAGLTATATSTTLLAAGADGEVRVRATPGTKVTLSGGGESFSIQGGTVDELTWESVMGVSVNDTPVTPENEAKTNADSAGTSPTQTLLFRRTSGTIYLYSQSVQLWHGSSSAALSLEVSGGLVEEITSGPAAYTEASEPEGRVRRLKATVGNVSAYTTIRYGGMAASLSESAEPSECVESEIVVQGVSIDASFGETVTASDTVTATAVRTSALTETQSPDAIFAGAFKIALSQTEAQSASDALGARVSIPQSLAETATPSDVEAASQKYGLGLSESETASDSAASSARDAAAAATETQSSADALAGAVRNGLSVTESQSSSDSLAVGIASGLTCSEAATPTEAVAAGQKQGLTVSESEAASEAVAAAVRVGLSVTESQGSSDSVAAALVAAQVLTESGTSTDQLAFQPLLGHGLSESQSSSDSSASALKAISTFSESATPQDLADSTVPGAWSLSESASASDSLSALSSAKASFVETGQPSDSAQTGIKAGLPVSTAQSQTSSDSASAGLSLGRSVSESETGTDSFLARQLLPGTLSETAQPSDGLDCGVRSSSNVSESAQGSDVLAAGRSVGLSVSESLVSSEGVDARVTLPASLVEQASADTTQVASQRASATFGESVLGSETTSSGTTEAPKTFNEMVVEGVTTSDVLGSSYTLGSALTESVSASETARATLGVSAWLLESADSQETSQTIFSASSGLVEQALALELVDSGLRCDSSLGEIVSSSTEGYTTTKVSPSPMRTPRGSPMTLQIWKDGRWVNVFLKLTKRT